MQLENNKAEHTQGMSTKSKIKLAVVIVSIAIVAVLVLQNRAPVTTRILWAEVQMPRIILLLLMLVIGFVLGAVYGGSLFKRKTK